MNWISPSLKNLGAGRRQVPGKALLLTAGVAILTGCGKPHGSSKAPDVNLPTAQVRVQVAESKPQVITEEVVGTVRAKVRATLEAKVTGRIEKLPVRLGQKVKAGELLARLDAAEIKARLEQAQAGLEQTERDWKRVSALFAQQAVTRSEYDASESRHNVAKATVAEAQAMMGYVEVLAPFDGVVTKKWAEAGDLAMPGKPLIEIQDPSALQLEADVPEAIASRVKLDARLKLRVDAVSGELTGTVCELAPTADSASRTFRVKLDLAPAAGLMPGQFARLLVPVGESRSICVPLSAVVQRGQLEIVFVVANQRAQLHLVKVGTQIGNEVEVLTGLDAGDAVVIDGAAQLTDGQPTEVK
jgi:RND family efflux transporter MFP subunit